MTGKRSGHQIKDGDLISAHIALCCMGKPDFEAIHETEHDPEFYALSLDGERLPSKAALCQRMDKIGESRREAILEANAETLRRNGAKPSPLSNGYVPADMDMTPFDNSKTKKERVSRKRKGFDGYAPMMAYFNEEGCLMNTELRPGKQHCQNHTPDFLRRTIGLCKSLTDAPPLSRLDSGNDAAEKYGDFIEGRLLVHHQTQPSQGIQRGVTGGNEGLLSGYCLSQGWKSRLYRFDMEGTI